MLTNEVHCAPDKPKPMGPEPKRYAPCGTSRCCLQGKVTELIRGRLGQDRAVEGVDGLHGRPGQARRLRPLQLGGRVGGGRAKGAGGVVDLVAGAVGLDGDGRRAPGCPAGRCIGPAFRWRSMIR
jgi:hypothetical protein